MNKKLSITFPNAFCVELDAVIGIHQAREIFWNEDHLLFNRTLEYQCSDENCRRPFSAVGVEPKLPIKNAIHFKIRRNNTHSDKCKYSNTTSIDKNASLSNSSITHNRLEIIPSQFVSTKQKISGQVIASTTSEQNKYDRQITKVKNYGSGTVDKAKSHKTRQLAVLVDCFNSHTPDFFIKTQQYLSIPNAKKKNRYFHECFREIDLFEFNEIKPNEQESYIYYGSLSHVTHYPTGFAIYFTYKPKLTINNREISVNLSIFIKHDDIELYNRKQELNQILKSISKTNNVKAIAYIINSYPYPTKTKFGKDAFSIKLDVLSDLYIEFESSL